MPDLKDKQGEPKRCHLMSEQRTEEWQVVATGSLASSFDEV